MLLKSIWSAPTNVRSDASHKLPDESLVIQPRAPEIRLEEIVAARRAMAA
jgi:hypothetical protein